MWRHGTQAEEGSAEHLGSENRKRKALNLLHPLPPSSVVPVEWPKGANPQQLDVSGSSPAGNVRTNVRHT